MKLEVAIVRDPNTGDWYALYINGKLITQDHSLDEDDVLVALQNRGVVTYERVNGTPGLTGYSFPEKLEDVQYDPEWKEEY